MAVGPKDSLPLAYAVGQFIYLRFMPNHIFCHSGLSYSAVSAKLLLPVLAVVAGATEAQEIGGNSVPYFKPLWWLFYPVQRQHRNFMPQADGYFPAEDTFRHMRIRAADGAVSHFIFTLQGPPPARKSSISTLPLFASSGSFNLPIFVTAAAFIFYISSFLYSLPDNSMRALRVFCPVKNKYNSIGSISNLILLPR